MGSKAIREEREKYRYKWDGWLSGRPYPDECYDVMDSLCV